MLSVEYSFAQTDAGWNPRGTAFEVLEVVAGMTSLCNLQRLEDMRIIDINHETNQSSICHRWKLYWLFKDLFALILVGCAAPISRFPADVKWMWFARGCKQDCPVIYIIVSQLVTQYFFAFFFAVVGLVALSLLLPSLIDAFLLRYLDSLVVGCGQPLLCPVLLRYVHGKGSAAMSLWRM